MTPIRILHLVHTPGPGGTEAVVANLLSWIPTTDAFQALACPDGPLATGAQQAGIQHFPVGFDRVRRSASPLTLARSIGAMSRVTRGLAVAIREFSPDIVHAHSAKAAVLARQCRRGRSSWMLVWHLHDYLPLGKLRRLWILGACRASDSILAVSRDVADTVLGSAHHATVIPNAISAPAAVDQGRGQTLLDCLGVPRGSPVLGYAGRLDPEKGVHRLLEVLLRVSEQEPSARLLIAGVSPFRPDDAVRDLEEVAARLGLEHRVHLLGRLPDLASFYDALTLFAHPAPREPFGLVILEALAHGVPVVAFKAGGPCEILAAFDPSFLVAVGDIEAYAAACCRIIRDPGVVERVRTAGPAFVSSGFSPNVQCGALLAHYRGMLSA